MAKGKTKSKNNEKELTDSINKQISNLDIAEKAIEKKYGKVMSLLRDHSDLKIDAISTGCLSLDAATGIGGLARGRVYEIFGANSSGKSTLALSTIMQALKRNMTVVYIDAEHALDPRLVRNMGKKAGVNADDIKLVQAFTGDDNLQIAEDLMQTGAIDVLVVDSITALLPQAMAEGEIGDNYIGQLARLMSKACNKLTPIVNRTNTLLIFINQVRVDINKYGDKNVPTGGEAVSFYATGRIKVKGGDTVASRILNDEGVVIGHESEFMIIKNKLSAPWRTAKIDLIYGQGYFYEGEMVRLAIDLGFINQFGTWFEFDGKKIQGIKSLVDIFVQDKSLYLSMRENVKKSLGL